MPGPYGVPVSRITTALASPRSWLKLTCTVKFCSAAQAAAAPVRAKYGAPLSRRSTASSGMAKPPRAGASGLQKGLLRRKVRGGSLGPVLIPQSGQQGLFFGGKHMVKKALPSDAFFHAACITQVNADAQNHEITAFSSASRSLGSFPSMTAVSSICRVAPTSGPAGMPASIKSAPFTVSWRMV